MPQLVVTGATLQCSMGTSPSSFTATSQTPTAVGAAGVVTDVTPQNVAPFGMCQSLANPAVATATSAAAGVLTPQPCLPVLSPWSGSSTRATVGDVPALDDAAQASCAWAGSVTVTAAGQASVTVQ